MDESPAELLMSRKLRTGLPTFKSLLEPMIRSTSQVHHKLLSRQQRQIGDPTTFQTVWRWTGENEAGAGMDTRVVAKQHQTPCSYPRWGANASKSYPSSTDQKGSTSCHKPSMGDSQRCAHPHYAIKDGHGYLGKGDRATALYPSASYPTSRSTCQKEPTDLMSTRAPYWNCLDIFKLDLSWGHRKLFSEPKPSRLFIFLITVVRRGDVTLLYYVWPRTCATIIESKGLQKLAKFYLHLLSLKNVLACCDYHFFFHGLWQAKSIWEIWGENWPLSLTLGAGCIGVW